MNTHFHNICCYFFSKEEYLFSIEMIPSNLTLWATKGWWTICRLHLKV